MHMAQCVSLIQITIAIGHFETPSLPEAIASERKQVLPLYEQCGLTCLTVRRVPEPSFTSCTSIHVITGSTV